MSHVLLIIKIGTTNCLTKKQYSSENIIESAIDGIEGEYTEQKDDHEEDRKENNEESEQIEQKHHFRR